MSWLVYWILDSWFLIWSQDYYTESILTNIPLSLPAEKQESLHAYVDSRQAALCPLTSSNTVICLPLNSVLHPWLPVLNRPCHLSSLWCLPQSFIIMNHQLFSAHACSHSPRIIPFLLVDPVKNIGCIVVHWKAVKNTLCSTHLISTQNLFRAVCLLSHYKHSVVSRFSFFYYFSMAVVCSLVSFGWESLTFTTCSRDPLFFTMI